MLLSQQLVLKLYYFQNLSGGQNKHDALEAIQGQAVKGINLHEIYERLCDPTKPDLIAHKNKYSNETTKSSKCMTFLLTAPDSEEEIPKQNDMHITYT